MPAGGGDFAISHVAALARLRLTPDEEALYAKQLGDILTYASQVLGVDTSAATPTSPGAIAPQGERPDEVRPSLPRDAVLRNAPDAANRTGLLLVPKVLG